MWYRDKKYTKVNEEAFHILLINENKKIGKIKQNCEKLPSLF